MQSKLQKAKERLQETVQFFSCPYCRGNISISDNTLYCENNHSFDVARKGYVHFASDVKNNFYQKELFLNRRAVYEHGFYNELLAGIYDIVSGQKVLEKGLLLDAGCGEGFFSHSLAGMLNGGYQLFGVDLSKEAVQLATGYDEPVSYLVGDIARLPFQNGSMSFILNILSPAHYGEFKRLLNDQGVVVKVAPGKNYLKEIREAAGVKAAKGPEQVMAHMEAQGFQVQRKTLCYQKNVPEFLLENVVGMSPVSRYITGDEMRKIQLDTITVHLEVLIGKIIE